MPCSPLQPPAAPQPPALKQDASEVYHDPGCIDKGNLSLDILVISNRFIEKIMHDYLFKYLSYCLGLAGYHKVASSIPGPSLK